MSRALLMGRFQPFHLGHLQVVKEILAEFPQLIVAVGSAAFNYLEKSPFTAGERIWMIHEALVEEGLDMRNIYILAYPNIENNAVWAAHLKSLLPPFQVAFTGNALPHILLREAGIEVRPLKMIKRDLYSATVIRERMLKGEDWESLVPPAVARIIKQIGGVERLRFITKGESDPLHW